VVGPPDRHQNTRVSMLQKFRPNNGPALVRADTLNVAPALVGARLARPSRRALAMGIDALLIAMISKGMAAWFAAGLIAASLRPRLERLTPGWRRGSHTAALLLLWAVLALFLLPPVDDLLHKLRDDDTATSASTAAEEDEDDVAAAKAQAQAQAAAAASAVQAALSSNPAASALSLADRTVSVIEHAASAAVAAQGARNLHLEHRVAQLEKELADARKPRVVRWQEHAQKLWHKAGRSLGWAIVYFSVLPWRWRGQTVGKRLLGLRIVELTGKPLDLITCFGRYGGYAAGAATGMVGFAQITWDINRQGIQDKIAHTVVLDERTPRAGVPPADALAPPQA